MFGPKQSEPLQRHRCNVCGGASQATQTDYTLIRAHRWRMVIQELADGKREPTWFCPKCWDLYKRKNLL